jgi:hypothetical protein
VLQRGRRNVQRIERRHGSSTQFFALVAFSGEVEAGSPQKTR